MLVVVLVISFGDRVLIVFQQSFEIRSREAALHPEVAAVKYADFFQHEQQVRVRSSRLLKKLDDVGLLIENNARFSVLVGAVSGSLEKVD